MEGEDWLAGFMKSNPESAALKQQAFLGAGNTSDWMQEDEFLIYLNNFQKRTNASNEIKYCFHLIIISRT